MGDSFTFNFYQPTQKRLIKIEGHQTKHMMMDNKVLIDKLAKLPKTDHEFFKVTALQKSLVLRMTILQKSYILKILQNL